MYKFFALTGIVLLITTSTFLAVNLQIPEKLPAPTEQPQAGTLTAFQPCEHTLGKQKIDAQCATLTVPENRDDPDSRLTTLPVVRIPSASNTPAEPVFVLLGGPGSSNFYFMPKDWLLANRDVIMVGYRGVDGSIDLKCQEILDVSAKYLGKGFLSEQATTDLQAATRSCAERLEAQGIDLRGYTTPAVVNDMEAVRMALGYEKINLWAESYGTRVAQIYAYLYPDKINRALMIGMNPPGNFVYDRYALDDLFHHLSDLCTKDPDCSARTSDLAQAFYDVNHDMPKRWLFLPIDNGSLRMLNHIVFFSTPQMPMIIDAYLAAANGDPAGLAILNFIGPFIFPLDMFHMGDFLNKGGTLDLEYYQGVNSINLADSIMGAPLAEWIWPMAADTWPIELIDEDLRQLQERDVDMLIVNGTLDFSTPPGALEKVKPYYQNAQTVLLAEFSHVGDVVNLQPEAFEQLVTSYYNTGNADSSLFVYQPIPFGSAISTTLIAKLFVAAIFIIPLLIIGAVWLIIRRVRRKKASA